MHRGITAGMVLLLVVGACRLELEADLYTSDIRKAAADPSAELTVPAIL